MLFIVLLSRIGRKASWPMRDIETLPSRQIYLYLSLVERREWEFYHNLDKRGYLVWLECISFFTFWRELMVSLENEKATHRNDAQSHTINELIWTLRKGLCSLIPHCTHVLDRSQSLSFFLPQSYSQSDSQAGWTAPKCFRPGFG